MTIATDLYLEACSNGPVAEVGLNQVILKHFGKEERGERSCVAVAVPDLIGSTVVLVISRTAVIAAQIGAQPAPPNVQHVRYVMDQVMAKYSRRHFDREGAYAVVAYAKRNGEICLQTHVNDILAILNLAMDVRQASYDILYDAAHSDTVYMDWLGTKPQVWCADTMVLRKIASK